MIGFRNTDVDVPFFWESDRQPPGRWHGEGRGPAQYLSSTPSASWCELVRHLGITDPADLAGIARTMWAVELPDDERSATPHLSRSVVTGGLASYPTCQAEAARLRGAGATRLDAPSAAVLDGVASGWLTDGGLRSGPPRAEHTIVLFGRRPSLVAWVAGSPAFPEPDILDRTRPL